jgi:ketosteroid isomerase-like protein
MLIRVFVHSQFDTTLLLMKYFNLLLLYMLIASCNSKPSPDSNATFNKDSLRSVLLNTDKGWSDQSLKSGYYHSRAEFVADSSIELMQGAMPLTGRKAIVDYAASHPDSSFTMQWTPLKADVAASGDLGYNYGGWMLKTKTKSGADTTLYGNYMTVWQKQPDGSWKYALDGGNDTPHPVNQ